MRKNTFQAAVRFIIRNRHHRTWKRIVSVLACVVVFCTTYALILPAITLEKGAACGIEEHTHTVDCYTQVTSAPRTILVCTQEGPCIHTHTDACLDENGALWCPLPETEAHTHGDGCYTLPEAHVHTDGCYSADSGELTCTLPTDPAEPVLICEKEERLPHGHTDACYETGEDGGSTTLICDMQEIPEHVHTADCFQDVEAPVDTESLTCTLPETEGHTHGDGCYDENNNLICQTEESQGHRHNALCYGTWILTCDREEHTHTPECMVDVETAEDWEKTLPETRSGNWAGDLVAVAESQLDYTEAQPDMNLGEEPLRYTRYGQWYGEPNGNWNSLFTMFCLHYAGIPEAELPQDSDVSAWVEKLSGRAEGYEAYRLYRDASYTPRPGDLVFLDRNGDETPDRVAIVTAYTSDEAPAAVETEIPETTAQTMPTVAETPETAAETTAETVEAAEPIQETEIPATVPETTAAAEPAQSSVILEAIEGDVSGQVVRQGYPMDGVKILGYAALPEKPETEYTWSQDGLEIKAVFGPEAVLPENATLVVERMTPPEGEELGALLEKGQGSVPPETAPQETEPQQTVPEETVTVELVFQESAYQETVSQETAAQIMIPAETVSQETVPAETVLQETAPAETVPQETAAQETVPRETAPQEDPESKCIDYFRVYLAVDGVEVDPQAPADVQILLQGDPYATASNIELVRCMADSAQTMAVEPDPAGNLTASFEGSLTGEYAVLAAADTAPRATGTNVAASLSPSKSIEALSQTNLYRLHLDAVVGASMMEKPMNMLLVVDRSGSMQFQMDTSGSSSNKSRDVVLKEVVNGKEDYYGNTTPGLIYNFLNKNPQNRVAVVGFAGASNYSDGSHDASVVTNWTGNKDTNAALGDGSGATNYCAAFVEADKMLAAIEAQNNNPTIMVFISDGRPTYYMEGTGRYGPSNEEDPVKVTECIEKSKPYFEEYIRSRHPNVTVYTVGMSTDIVGDGKDAILQEMANKGGGDYFPATSAAELQEAINSISSGKTYTDLRIEDKLSAYVELAAKPDYKVTKTAADGTPTVLYENGAVTTAGTGVIASVGPSADKKTVTATFASSYELEPGASYSLSYNVKVSQAAKDAYAANNTYPDTGDANTDYDTTKATSSGQPGFRSNDTATMFYKADGKDGSKLYPHPVVQVALSSGPSAQPEIDLAPHKTIDSFRDGADNPDTTLDNNATDKTDLYRLYLDAELDRLQQPIDLLIVVDQSGSMHKDYRGAYTETGYEIITDPDSTEVWNDMLNYQDQKIFRDEAVNLVLNGDAQHKGLISQFLSAEFDDPSKHNNLAVATFEGRTTDPDDNNNYGPNASNAQYSISDNTDAETVLEWTSDPTASVNIQGQRRNATNYTAAFQEAESLLEKTTSGNRQVMLFLSDGKPTAYIAQAPDGHYYRGGNGADETDGTGDATTTAFAEFVENHPDLLIHTVSIHAADATTRLDGMKSSGVGHCYSVNTTENLQRALSKLMYGSAYVELVIEDTLSEYVDLYSDQPDYKVTLTNPDGTVAVLYENGSVTAAGQGILESVTYVRDERKVTAKFTSTYIPEPGCKVTLSFNVKTTQNAYNTYAASGYGNCKGDPSTDYTGNATSSGQDGFFSNIYSSTQVTYKEYNENLVEDPNRITSQKYPKPVIQVSADAPGPGGGDPELSLTLHKTIDSFRDGADNPDTQLDTTATDKNDLYRLYLDTQVGSPVGMPMDLLLVVDQSSSMRNNPISTKDNTTREQTLLHVLNGTANDGLIHNFLSMDNRNQIAILGFDGWQSNRLSDTKILRGWGRIDEPVTLDGGLYTDYIEALEVADTMLSEAKKARPDIPKVMVFLSDGDPTIYYVNGTKRDDYYQDSIYSIPASKKYFEETFLPNNRDVKIYTVGISSDIASTLLQDMATGGGTYFAADSVDKLANALESVRRGNAYSGVQIQDELSAYVDVYTPQPDYKVTMKDAAGAETVIWPDENGFGIIQSVGAEGKTVTATFAPDYLLETDCTYTLSYNVRVTEQAHQEYSNSQYPEGVIGDANTDYTGNGTSSGKAGFRSNHNATLSYYKDSSAAPTEKFYPHPVVQVIPSGLTVQKQWLSYGGDDVTATQTDVQSVDFQLIKIATPTEAPQPDKATINVTSQYRYYSYGYAYWYNGAGASWEKDAPIGSTATLTIRLSRTSGMTVTAKKSGGNAETLSGSNGVYTYDFQVDGDTSIEIRCERNSGNMTSDPITSLEVSYSNIPTTEATPVELDGGTYKLSKANNWQKVFSDLPKTGTENIGGKNVAVTYDYTVKEKLVNGYESTTKKETSADGSSTIFTITNKSTTQPYKIVILKTDAETNAPIGNDPIEKQARFEVYRTVREGETGAAMPGGTGAAEYFKIRERCLTDKEGRVVIEDLVPGNYWLVETDAPAGYYKATAPIPFTIDENGTVAGSSSVTLDGETLPQITVPNKPWGHKMPHTGGAGTYQYTIGGMLIISLALLLLYDPKKRGKGDAISS